MLVLTTFDLDERWTAQSGRSCTGAESAVHRNAFGSRSLAEARPDAFRPDLALSLNNLSNCLSDLGRREDALAAIEEAVRIRRSLAEARPDAFRPDLALSLNNYSNHLSELGRREDALAAIEEAVRIRRSLAEAACCFPRVAC